jgi:hypothetical protein
MLLSQLGTSSTGREYDELVLAPFPLLLISVSEAVLQGLSGTCGGRCREGWARGAAPSSTSGPAARPQSEHN